MIRAYKKSSSGASKVIDLNYFAITGPFAQYKELTTLSIVTNLTNLFDPDIGIYVTGNKFIQRKKSPEYKGKALEIRVV